MKKLIISLLLLCSVLLLGAQQPEQLPNDPAVRTGRLENGLTYYIHHNENPKGRAEFYLATHVGAIQETPDQDGLAHFLEHMCFNGTKNFPGKGILDWLQGIGASFGGNVNAATGVETTQYMLNNIPLVRETVIDTCLLILHDYSHFVTNDPEEIDKERGVIVEERRSRRNADWRMHEKSLPYYYGDSKYGSCTLIGSQENLLGFRPESLVEFYRTWYRPDLQAVIVVGDVDPDYVEAKLAAVFADIPAAEHPQPKEVIRIPDNAEPAVGIITDPEASGIAWEILWKSEALPAAWNSTAVGLMQDLVEGLVDEIMQERLDDISVRPDTPFQRANFGIGNLCETMKAVTGQVSAWSGKALPALEAFLTEAEKMRRYGFTEDEVGRAKERILATFETAANRADTRTNAQLVPQLTGHFFKNVSYMVPAERAELVRQLLAMVPTEALNQVAARLITPENMVILYKAPEKEGMVHPDEAQVLALVSAVREADIEAVAAQELEKEFLNPASLKGSGVEKTAASLHGATEWTLGNGVRVVLLPNGREKDRILIKLVKDGGSSLIPTKDLPSFEPNILGLFLQQSGVSRFPNMTVEKMLAGKNLNISPYIDERRHGISGSTTAKDFETALQLLYLMFTDFRFDPNEFGSAVLTIRNILPNIVGQPNYRLQQEMIRVLYGNDPRHFPISEKVLRAASLKTIRRNWRRLFADAAGATVYIAGDFDPDTVRPLVEKYIGSLPRGRKPLRWIDRKDDILPGMRTRDFAVDMQTPKTTVFEVLSADMEYTSAHEAALDALSYIMDMRYTASLREEEGGTYGAQSQSMFGIEPRPQAIFQLYFDCRPSLADKLRALAEDELRKMAEEGPTAEEFDMAIKNLQKRLPEREIQNSYWLSALQNWYEFGIDIDKGDKEAAQTLTPEAVRDMARRLLGSGNRAALIMRPGDTTEEE